MADMNSSGEPIVGNVFIQRLQTFLIMFLTFFSLFDLNAFTSMSRNILESVNYMTMLLSKRQYGTCSLALDDRYIIPRWFLWPTGTQEAVTIKLKRS